MGLRWKRGRWALVLGLTLAGCTVEAPDPGDGGELVRISPEQPPMPGPGGIAPDAAEGAPPPLLAAPRKPSLSAPELLAKAEQLIDARDLKGAERLLDDALMLDPDNRLALKMLAETSQFLGMKLERPLSSPFYLKSGRAMRRLLAKYKDLTPDEKRAAPTILYNEACTLALQGESAQAIESLRMALDAGFNVPDQFDRDDELDSLRKSPDFAELQRRIERTLVERLLPEGKQGGFAFDFTLPEVSGEPFTLADWRGKVVIVDFGGTWCPPCRKEVPHLKELAKTYKDRGLEVVSLFYESEEGDAARDLVAKFKADQDINYPCVLGDVATRDKVPRFVGYPTTLFIDREGQCRLVMGGYQPFLALEAVTLRLLEEGQTKQGKSE